MFQKQIFLNPFRHKDNIRLIIISVVMINVMMMMMIFVVWFSEERCLALFSAGTIVRDPHRISDTPRTGFEPVQNLSSGFC